MFEELHISGTTAKEKEVKNPEVENSTFIPNNPTYTVKHYHPVESNLTTTISINTIHHVILYPTNQIQPLCRKRTTSSCFRTYFAVYPGNYAQCID